MVCFTFYDWEIMVGINLKNDDKKKIDIDAVYASENYSGYSSNNFI